MDAIVTARIPVEVKEQGNSILREIGSTPTELINAAYNYVLNHHELPIQRKRSKEGSSARQALSDAQRSKIAASLKAMYVGDPMSSQNASFKEMLNEARDERYARFA